MKFTETKDNIDSQKTTYFPPIVVDHRPEADLSHFSASKRPLSFFRVADRHVHHSNGGE